MNQNYSKAKHWYSAAAKQGHVLVGKWKMAEKSYNSDMVVASKKRWKAISIRAETSAEESTAVKIAAIRDILHKEYCQKHRYPWIIAYSGGKDSTLLLDLVMGMLIKLPPEMRLREIHVVSNDTLVESPLVIEHLYKSMVKIRQAAQVNELPIRVAVTKPDIDQTFWVNVIGRGYAPPSRIFRWCTDRMKIQPTNNYITRQTNIRGKTILLIGARRSESSNRKRTMDRYYEEGKLMSKHPSLAGCSMFSPLANLETDEVWMTLLQKRPPWGGTYRNLITLYRNAGGGECPLVLSKEDAPSCGTTSPRFGCWTCTVVPKDRSMAGLVDSGFDKYEPLMEFRNWLQSIRSDTSRRMRVRRDGTIIYKEGKPVYGPFTLDTRKEILDKLSEIQNQMEQKLISEDERDYITYIWRHDAIMDKVHSRTYL